ncbi:MAG: hypothetical protein C5B49_14285 [Bdellovibrio sp.]|nr:MAG: hypothetical protein C5B49_14285 [Bdellovibrio sp.]
MTIFLLFFGLMVPGAQAQVHVSSISAASAGTGRAAVEPLDTPFLNPAALPYSPGYYFGMGYSVLRSSNPQGSDVLALALTDNLPETVIPTTLAFVQEKHEENGTAGVRKDLRLGVGNFIVGRNALGLGLAYRMAQSEFTSTTQQLNMFAGTMVAINKELSVALVLENILPPSNATPEPDRLSPSTSLGLSYNFRTVMRAKLDVISEGNNSFGRPTVAFGLENYWNRWLIFRVGVSHNSELAQNIASAGAGFGGPRFGIHYAFQNIQGPDGTDPRHSVDLSVPIW